MPCDTITLVNIEAGKMNPDLFEEAIKEMGHRYRRNGSRFAWNGNTYDAATGTLTMQDTGNAEGRTAEIKRAYSAAIIKSQAKKFGWTLKQNPKDKYAYEVTKR